MLLNAKVYYIDPQGIDEPTRDGSITAPWKTLAYACSKAISLGDIIHVNAGKYTETSYSSLAIGVSIEGVGDSSHIIYTYSDMTWTNACLRLVSTKEGTNGNQSISYLKFDGSTQTAKHGLLIRCRSNVKIHNCTFIDFNNTAIQFNGKATGYEYNKPPLIFALGNELKNCTIIDCARNPWSETYPHHGMITFTGQSGLVISDNILKQVDAPVGYNMNIIDATEGVNKGIKYYNNRSYKPDDNGKVWNMHWENWDCLGGFEVYNNEFYGGGQHIDAAGYYNVKGPYGYSWWIHDNLFYQDVQKPVINASRLTIGVQLEGSGEDLIINNNHFLNISHGIYFAIGQAGRKQENISIYYNIFQNIGYTNYNSFVFVFSTNKSDAIQKNFHFDNNVIISNTIYKSAAAWFFNVSGSTTDIYIRNNIVQNMSIASIYISTGTGQVGSLYSLNNIFYGNGNKNNIYILPGETVTNYVNTGNLVANPLLVSNTDFHLQPGSPGIGAGIDVGLLKDYEGNSVKNPPSIGAYEHASLPPTPVIPVYQSSSVENITPSIIELIYDITLNSSIVPDTSAFKVLVNGNSRKVNSVIITGNKVRLILNSPVVYGDIITITYTQPASNPLQTPSAGLAASISLKTVTNNLVNPVTNSPPVIVVNYSPDVSSGFIYEIDASGTTDKDNDLLSFTWTIPADVPLSSKNAAKIRYLCPIVTSPQVIPFELKVSDGKTETSKIFSVTNNPYKPGLGLAKVKIIEASNYNSTDYPQNVNDGNLTTKWSVDGDNQWLTISLAESFKINYIQIAFLPDQKDESYFDIYASKDNKIWDNILTQAFSCNFSGNLQNFDVPIDKSDIEYNYVKLFGHGSLLSTWNNYSEIRLFGEKGETNYNIGNDNISIYPNPATDYINISILEPISETQILRIFDFSGRLRQETTLETGVYNMQVPIRLSPGAYIAEVISGPIVILTKALIVEK